MGGVDKSVGADALPLDAETRREYNLEGDRCLQMGFNHFSDTHEAADEAVLLFTKALSAYRHSGNREGECIVLGNIGCALDSLLRHEHAVSYHQKHLALATELNDMAEIGRAHGNLGFAFAQAGDFDNALQHADTWTQHAYRFHRKGEAPSRSSTIRYTTGSAFSLERAEALGREALASLQAQREAGEGELASDAVLFRVWCFLCRVLLLRTKITAASDALAHATKLAGDDAGGMRAVVEELRGHVEAERVEEAAYEARVAEGRSPAPGTPCNACGAVRRSLRKCSRCGTVWYCDRECQKQHWSKHKHECKPATTTTTTTTTTEE